MRERRVMNTMTAAVLWRHGGPEALEVQETERPEPQPGELLIKVAACALGGLDLFVRNGMPGVTVTFPHICGGQIVGDVQACGSATDEELLGARVLIDPELPGHRMLGETALGGLAEYIVVPADNVVRLRHDADPLPFSTLPVGYATAHRMLFTRGGLTAGETVAVLGAAGGVGVACVQLAKLAGARVIACSSSPSKLELLADLGADELINTSEEDLGRSIWQLTDKQGADVIVDYLGADTLATSVRSARRFGRVLVCGASTGFDAPVDLRYLWTRESQVIGSNGWERRDIEQLVTCVEDGSLVPVIHRVYPLAGVADAFADLEQRRAFGTVVVVPDRDHLPT